MMMLLLSISVVLLIPIGRLWPIESVKSDGELSDGHFMSRPETSAATPAPPPPTTAAPAIRRNSTIHFDGFRRSGLRQESSSSSSSSDHHRPDHAPPGFVGPPAQLDSDHVQSRDQSIGNGVSSPLNHGGGGGERHRYANLDTQNRYPFKIGVIVPRTAFLSQYKSYKQRMKDTYNSLNSRSKYTFPNYFNLVSELVDLSSKSSISDITNALCSKLIEQNVSVIIYLEKDEQSVVSGGSSSSTPPSTAMASLQQQSVNGTTSGSQPPPPPPPGNEQSSLARMVAGPTPADAEPVNLSPETGSSREQNKTKRKYPIIQPEVVASDLMMDRQQRRNKHVGSSSNKQQDAPILNPITDNGLAQYRWRDSATDYIQAMSKSSPASASKSSPASASKSSPASASRSQNANASNNDSISATDLLVPANQLAASSSSQAHFLMHLAGYSGIPMIAWSVEATSVQRAKNTRTLHLAPTVAHQAKAMFAIMNRYSWHTFSVITTTLAGNVDFILAIRELIVQNSMNSKQQREPVSRTAGKSQVNNHHHHHHVLQPDEKNHRARRHAMADQKIPFKLLDVIILKKRSRHDLEQELRPLTASESRVMLLYASKESAIEIMAAAKQLKLTRKTYAWIVAQSVIGANDNERAPSEFQPGILGIHFRSNHERLLDEVSRAITIISYGLELFVRDHLAMQSNKTSSLLATTKPINNANESLDGNTNQSTDQQHSSQQQQQQPFSYLEQQNYPWPAAHPSLNLSDIDIGSHSSCKGPLSQKAVIKGNTLYEYFRKSSPSNLFDADGSLRDVELNVVNLDNERQWKRIGYFTGTTLKIDDITWPEQAERPPTGLMEKFHLKAVFLEEPAFVNLADPDTETGECKTNRAVRCRYVKKKKASPSSSKLSKISAPNDIGREMAPMSNDNFTIARRLHADQLMHNTNRQRALDGDGKTNAPGNVARSMRPTQNNDGYNNQNINNNINNNQNNDNDDDYEYEYKCCSGFCIDLMEKFATDLKFTYDLYRVKDGVWGVLNNGKWNGLIAELVNRKADVIVTSVKINSDRQKAVDFTVPFLDTGISIIVNKQTGVISKLAFLEPFDTLAWLMFIGVGIPVAAISIFFFEWASPSGFYANGKPSVDRKFSFCRTLWMVMAILFGSAAHIDSPKGYTARFMGNIWASFAVVFLAVYTANLAAFMITREEYLDFSGIGDRRLYNRNLPLRFGTIAGGNTEAVLSANKPNLHKYMQRFNKSSSEEGVSAVRQGALDAFIYDAVVLDYLAGQDPDCKLINVGAWYSMTGYALAFPRNSRYFEKFNMKMLEYRKNGELDRLRRFWLQGLCKPGQNRHSISKPLDLSQFMSAFLLLGAGILVSVLIFALEHLYIMYLRDRLIRNKTRRQLLVEWIRPISLSLADTLREPSRRSAVEFSEDEDAECCGCSSCNERFRDLVEKLSKAKRCINDLKSQMRKKSLPLTVNHSSTNLNYNCELMNDTRSQVQLTQCKKQTVPKRCHQEMQAKSGPAAMDDLSDADIELNSTTNQRQFIEWSDKDCKPVQSIKYYPTCSSNVTSPYTNNQIDCVRRTRDKNQEQLVMRTFCPHSSTKTSKERIDQNDNWHLYGLAECPNSCRAELSDSVTTIRAVCHTDRAHHKTCSDISDRPDKKIDEPLERINRDGSDHGPETLL